MRLVVERGVILRLAQAAEAAAIAEVHERTGRETYRGFVPEAYLDSVSVTDLARRWRARLEDQDQRTTTWVAEEDRAVVGFCHVGPSPDAGAPEETGHVHALYVATPCAGRGIGAALLSAGVASLQDAGFREATLWVLADNLRARGFYEHQGWRTDGASKNEEQAGVTFHELRYRKTMR